LRRIERSKGRAAVNARTSRTAVEKFEERVMTTRNGQHEKERSTTATDYVAAKAHETVDTIAERAQRAEREVRGAAERTAEQARQLRDQYAETAEEGLKRATSYLESNPLAVVGIAFVAGVLVATMMRR